MIRSSRLPLGITAAAVCVLMGALTACGPSRRLTDVSGGDARATGAKARGVHVPADQIVLQVRRGGGKVPTESILGDVASLTVYGDGRVFKPDPSDPGRPGDLIRFTVGRIDQRVLDELVARFQRSDLFSGAKVDFGDPRVMDAPTTSVMFHASGTKPVQLHVYALGPSFDRNVQGAPGHRREMLARLLAWADDATTTEATQPYEPERVLVHELEASDFASTTAAAWPGPDLDLSLTAADPRRSGWRCGVVQGTVVGPIVSAAERRSSGTAWRWNGRIRYLVLRPLLPGEPGCER